MGIDRTITDRPLTGVLLPDPRIAFWSAQSSLDEADPIPGVASPVRTTELSLTASGTPSTSTIHEVLAQSSGVPELGGASFVWRESGDVRYRGWDYPHALTRFDSPTWTTSTTAGRRFIDIAKTHADSLIVVADFPNTAGGSETRRVSVNRRTAAGVWSGFSTIYTDTDTVAGSDFMLHPTVNVLPNGTIEIFHFTHDHDSQRAQIIRQTSTDDGVSWTISDRLCLLSPFDTSGGTRRTPVGMRCRQHGGQHLLIIDSELVGGTSPQQAQYSSRDGGAHFESIGTIASIRHSRIANVNGYWYILYADVSAAPQQARIRRIASTQTPLSQAVAVAVLSTATTVQTQAIVGDEGGRLYALVRRNDDLQLASSDDLGSTWLAASFVTSLIPSTSSNVQRGDATFFRGQIIYAGNHDHGTGDHSLLVAQFGGYTNLCLPKVYAGGTLAPAGQASWSRHWIGIDDLPGLDSNWTVTNVGGGAPTIQDGFAQFVGGGGLTRAYEFLDATTNGLTPAFARMTCGGTSGDCRLFVRLSDNVNSFAARASYSPASGTITLVDVYGILTLGTASVAALSTVEIMVGASSSPAQGALWYRVRDAAGDDREWTFLAAGALTSGGAGQGARRMQYETNDGAGSYDNILYDLAIAFGVVGAGVNFQTAVGAGMSADPANPADLRGRDFSPFPVYLHDGQSIAAFGLARGGDSWTIEPHHTFEAEKVIPSQEPSPSRGWRSLTGGSKTIAFQLFSPNTHLTSDLFGLYLDRVNFRRFRLETRQGGVWNDRGTFDLSTQVGYQRIGDVIIPRETGTTQAANVYFRRDEIRDGVFQFDTLTTVRAIAANGPGTEDRGPIDEFRYWLRLAGITGAEPVGPIAGAFIWYPRCMLTFALLGNNELEGFRLVINPGGTDPNPPSGDIRIGVMAAGPIQVLGWQPDDTRSVSRELDGDVVTYQRDGTAVREVIAPQYRTHEVAWTRPSWQGWQQRTSDPDYVTASSAAGAEPVGTRHGGIYDWDGILTQHGRLPLVFIPRIDRDASQTHLSLANYAGGAVYGRFVPGSYRIETSVGAPEYSEFVRSSVVTIQEER